ncbi:hypothetical protein CXG81DRAFT_12047 [Caulochytrium protostelioides]|uniref:Dynein regulatory complex subunit 7 n=1 Tax=Caulochytrium protostelioides TaxID=1555241 RepID=A0A4P9X826_9FUNG|nr:hypothetical protein CXG81DRAFT_12047 [Caulochytrium protostelioides]|eukprot:RKP01424.1 hypothetical protein CXG81DRAFT_12047 [Caulochytrium protostelioides]
MSPAAAASAGARSGTGSRTGSRPGTVPPSLDDVRPPSGAAAARPPTASARPPSASASAGASRRTSAKPRLSGIPLSPPSVGSEAATTTTAAAAAEQSFPVVVEPRKNGDAVSDDGGDADSTGPPDDTLDVNGAGRDHADTEDRSDRDVDGDGDEDGGDVAPSKRLASHERQYEAQQAEICAAIQSRLLDKTCMPPSYWSLSDKETQLHIKIQNFARQYRLLYPSRKDLLLLAPNEFGVEKFVCNTFRLTQLPYRELYDYRSCAQFVYRYLTYEPLDPPQNPPAVLYSPTWTLATQKADAYGYAILLTSLLQGVGYDAYVVSGYASRHVTLLDEREDLLAIENFDLMQALQDAGASAASPRPANKYRLRPVRQLASVYMREQAQRAEKAALAVDAKRQHQAQQQAVEAKEADDADQDPLHGMRVHAWVLVTAGKRDIAESFFLEPTTGRVVRIDDSRYLGIESVFNSRNVWVNMQVCFNGLNNMSFDLADNSKWEFVLMDSNPMNRGGGGSSSSGNGVASGNANGTAESDLATARAHAAAHAAGDGGETTDDLDNPMDTLQSWVAALTISKHDFDMCCPMGFKVTVHKDCKEETFVPYHRKDGLIKRLTFMKASDAAEAPIVYSFYTNRRDQLAVRIAWPQVNRIEDHFRPGRPHGVRMIRTEDGDIVETRFTPATRPDALLRRVMRGDKVMEWYRPLAPLGFTGLSHPDRLPDLMEDPELPIVKMTEHFARSDKGVHDANIEKITYAIKQERVTVRMHRASGMVVPDLREYKKPQPEETAVGQWSDVPVYFCARMTPPSQITRATVAPGGGAHTPPLSIAYAALRQLLKREAACLSHFKNTVSEMGELAATRSNEEADVVLVVAADDVLHRPGATNPNGGGAHGKDDAVSLAAVDFLSPFLVHAPPLPASGQYKREDAIAIRDAFMAYTKERHVEKAQVMALRLESVSQAYGQRQTHYARNAERMLPEETEQYVAYCHEALFRIAILERRLNKFKKSVPKLLQQAEERARTDPRLALAYGPA